jgi:hypothetical protein
MVENFADHPKSITEVRAERSESARDWTPRDVLIDLLRAIDEKKLDPDAVVVVVRPRAPEGIAQVHYRIASPDIHTTLGMLSSATFKINKESWV